MEAHLASSPVTDFLYKSADIKRRHHLLVSGGLVFSELNCATNIHGWCYCIAIQNHDGVQVLCSNGPELSIITLSDFALQLLLWVRPDFDGKTEISAALTAPGVADAMK
ncbi:MAG: hypothetical protein IPP45_11835 [Sphingomonadales bacterium]|nr:hypothetical protein [Sphingomonadales bacterium]